MSVRETACLPKPYSSQGGPSCSSPARDSHGIGTDVAERLIEHRRCQRLLDWSQPARARAVSGRIFHVVHKYSSLIMWTCCDTGLANSKTIAVAEEDGAIAVTVTRPKNKSKPAQARSKNVSKKRVQRQASGVGKLATSVRPDLKVRTSLCCFSASCLCLHCICLSYQIYSDAHVSSAQPLAGLMARLRTPAVCKFAMMALQRFTVNVSQSQSSIYTA